MCGVLGTQWHRTFCDPIDLQPSRLFGPWNSPGKNTGVGCLSLLKGTLPDPGMKPRSPALQADYLPTELQGKPVLCHMYFKYIFSLNIYVLTLLRYISAKGFPRWLSGKESTCNGEDVGSVPESGRSPREGNGNPLQYFLSGKSL